jgi:ribosome-binding factor A
MFELATSYRINRIQEQLLRELSDIVQKLKDPRVRMVTVVDTEVSKDLRHAKMFVSSLGDKQEQEEAIAALDKARGFLRREIAQRLRLRMAPEIHVVYDNTSERAAHLTSLIDGLGLEQEKD